VKEKSKSRKAEALGTVIGLIHKWAIARELLCSTSLPRASCDCPEGRDIQ